MGGVIRVRVIIREIRSRSDLYELLFVLYIQYVTVSRICSHSESSLIWYYVVEAKLSSVLAPHKLVIRPFTTNTTILLVFFLYFKCFDQTNTKGTSKHQVLNKQSQAS